MPVRTLFLVTLVAGLSSFSAAPAAGVTFMVDAEDGLTFTGSTTDFVLAATSSLPLGDSFGPVDTNVILTAVPGTGFDVRAIFPGQGGQTVEVNDGDEVFFEVLADLLLGIEVLDVDPVADFGGGLGNIGATTTAQIVGTGLAVANTSLPNLGLLSNAEFMSLLLGIAGGNLATIPLGADLDGDAVNDVLSFENFSTSFSDSIYDAIYDASEPAAIDMGDILPFGGSGGVNPNFALTLDVVEWTIEQDVLVPAETVPEPAPLALIGLAVSWAGVRRATAARA